jgi:hypothetical protein
MSGGKGGGQSTKTEIPEWAESATKRNLARAEEVQKIGYMPYYGPDVAGFTPSQQAAMQNNLSAASAFGMAAPTDAMAGMPQAQDFGGGISGYSSGNLFDQAVAEFEAREPAYAKEYNELFAGNTYTNPFPGPGPINFPMAYDPNRFSRASIPMPETRGGAVAQMPSMPPQAALNLPTGPFEVASPTALPMQPAARPTYTELPTFTVDPVSPVERKEASRNLPPKFTQPPLMDIPLPTAPAMNVPAAPKKGIDALMLEMRNAGRNDKNMQNGRGAR